MNILKTLSVYWRDIRVKCKYPLDNIVWNDDTLSYLLIEADIFHKEAEIVTVGMEAIEDILYNVHRKSLMEFNLDESKYLHEVNEEGTIST